MRRAFLLLFALAPIAALGSLPMQMTVADMTTEADHVLVGHVAGVDMVDGSGSSIMDDQARTGPGSSNVIRIRVAIDEILVSNAEQVPKVLLLPLDPFMHYSLGQIKAAHRGDSTPRLVLLKGAVFSSLKPGIFFLPLREKDEVLRVRGAAHR